MKSKFILLLTLVAFCTNCLYAGNWKAKHVIVIGFDGWGSYSVAKAKMPYVKHLMENGSYTLKKRSVLPSSSAINWATMFMGAGPEVHGYTLWNSKVPEIPSSEVNKDGIFPTIFSVFRDAYPKAEIGCLYQWEGIKYVVDTLSMSYQKQIPDNDQFASKECDMAVKYIKERRPALAFFYWDNPDEVGHHIGWYTPAYYQKLEELDGYVGRIVNAVKEAGMLDNTIFIISSDHGGIGKGHGGKTLLEMEAPFIIYGKDVKKGHEIEVPMMQYDIAATIASIFKLKQPQAWRGRPVSEVFIK